MIVYSESSSFFTKKRLLILSAGIVIASVLFFLYKDLPLATFLPHPIFVKSPGNFLTAPAEIELSTPISGEIFYTLDGSAPTPQARKYVQKITLEKSAVLQFAVFQGGRQLTKTQSYDAFVNGNHSVPVFSLVTDPKNLWDPETGIYVTGNHQNFRQSGKEWERPAELRFYDENRNLEFSQNVAIRLHGTHMRSMPQKSFRIYSTDEDGRNTMLRYPLFGPEGNREYETFVLRNGGGDAQRSMLRDPLASRLVEEGSDLAVLKSRPVVLYLNGEYWGLYYMAERFDNTYFAQRFQVKKKALSTIQVPLDISERRGMAVPDKESSVDDANFYNQLLQSVRSCGNCTHYERLNIDLDMQSLTDYYLFELFFNNVDWPFNNMKMWRYDTDVLSAEAQVLPELDGRFRWLFYDLDAGFSSANTTEDVIASAQGDNFTKLVDDSFPFRNLFYDPVFRRRYNQRLQELTKTTLSAQHMEATIDELAAEIRPEMPRYIERWGSESSLAGHSVVKSMEEWERQVELLKVYVRHRPDGYLQRAESFFRSTAQ